MRRKFKIYRILIISFILFMTTVLSIGYLVNKQVNVFIVGLADKISKQLGNEVSIGTIRTKWSWLHLRITINDIVIKDYKNDVSICSIKSIIGVVNAYDTIASFKVKFKSLLIRSPRLAIQWDGINQIKLAGLQHSQDSAGNVDPLPLLYFLSMQNRVMLENGDIHIQGLNGSDLPLMNVKLDFKKLSNLEYQILSRGEVAAAVQPEFNVAAHYHGSLDDLANYLLDFELKTSNVQLQNLLNLIPQYNNNNVIGNFKTLDFKGAVQNGKLRFLNSDFEIAQLQFGDDIFSPSGSGHVEYRPDSDKIIFSASNVHFLHKQLFDKDIILDAISGSFTNLKIDDMNELKSEDLKLKIQDFELNPTITARWSADKLEELDFVSVLQHGHVQKIAKLMPDKKLPPGFTSWINTSFVDGFIQKINFKYAQNKPYLQVEFTDTELKFSKDWPLTMRL